MRKYWILNSKGGIGKTTLSILLLLYFDRNADNISIIDCDQASASLTRFLKLIEKRKGKHIKYTSFNLIGTDKRIDRTKMDYLLEETTKLDNVIIDFGAASSEQILYYLREESANGIIDILKENEIRLLIVMAGGGSAKECIDYFSDLKSIDGIKEVTKIVANEFLGGVNGLSVKDYTKADLQIGVLTEDLNSDAQKQWTNAFNQGLLFEDLQQFNIVRRRRILNYLDNIFKQVDKL